MNRISRIPRYILAAAALLCAPAICDAQSPDIVNDVYVSLTTNNAELLLPTQTQSTENRINALKTRRYSCELGKRPKDLHETAYATSADRSELIHLHAPAVFTADHYIFASDGFSLYQFERADTNKQAGLQPKYTSDQIVAGVTDKSVIQKQRIGRQSCITSAPLSNPADVSQIFCSDKYYKAQYYGDAIYILTEAPCPKGGKSCRNPSASLERYEMDSSKQWNVTLSDKISAHIAGITQHTILIIDSNGSLTAVESESGSILYTKNYSAELALEKDYYQFNHFWVDDASGLFIVASRHHNVITVIDIKTGDIIKTHDFGKAYAHNKFLEEDYHYIELGDFAFPLNKVMGMDNGVMYLRKDKNVIAAIELKTGKQLWKYDIFGSPLNDNPAQNRENIAYQIGDILITDDLVIVGYDKYTTALKKSTGETVWNYSFFPFNGHFGYQMFLSCTGDHLMVQSDRIYLYNSI